MIVGNAHRSASKPGRESATETILILEILTGSKVKSGWVPFLATGFDLRRRRVRGKPYQKQEQTYSFYF